MVNFSRAISENVSNSTSGEGDIASVPVEVSTVISIIINTITCPFTVLLNVLVIQAVKTRPRLRTNSNILLACLAVTDALSGLLGQPSYILWRITLIFGISSSQAVASFNYDVMAALVLASYLHLMLVTFERLVAIKFTMHYSSIMTHNTIKITVSVFWIISFLGGVFSALKMYYVLLPMTGLATNSCIVFVASAYLILYHETRRHQKKLKAEQLPAEEVERSSTENRALKTTMFVVGAVVVCLLPLGFCLIVMNAGLYVKCPISDQVWQRFGLLNSFVNPLIYCFRQKEMKKFIFGKKTHVVQPFI